MISRPLLTMDAQSTVILRPMFQVGWRSTSSTRAESIFSLGQSRSAPPEAVSRRLRTGFPWAACRHWKMALCSLSTGSRGLFSRLAFSMTRSPPVTSASLLARSTCEHTSSAVHTASRPAMPVMAQSAASGFTASSTRLEQSGPKNHWQKRRSSGMASGSHTMPAACGRNSRTSANSFSLELFAVRQAAEKRSG